MTAAEIEVIKRWRAEHKLRWWIRSRLKPFMWRIVGIFYRHKSLELQCNPFFGETWMSDEHYYDYPEDFLFRYSNFVWDGKLHLKYFPRWWGICGLRFRSPEKLGEK